MAERAIPRVTRLLGIVSHLAEYGEASFEELGEHFGVPSDQVRADIETLWVSGLPGYGTNDLLDFDAWAFDEGVARLTNSQGVRQVALAPSEAVSLLAALASMTSAGIAPPGAAGLMAKLSAAVGAATSVTVVPHQGGDPGLGEQLRAAAGAGRRVQVDYIDAQDRRTTRVVEPHRLVAVDGVGYLECYCLRAEDYRTLRLNRILGAVETGEAATHPPRPGDGFALQPEYQASVRLRRSSRWAVEGLPGVGIEEDGDDVVASFGVANPDAVATRLLIVGEDLVDVRPEPLRERLRAAAAGVLAAHAGR